MPLTPESNFIVRMDDTEIRCLRPDGTVERVAWAELSKVGILTTADGPFAPDVFWVLQGGAGGCVIPWGANGDTELLHILGQLPGFRHEVVIAAGASTSEGTFLCWEGSITVMPEQAPLRFIVANYGTRHLGMLLAHLDSVARSHPAARQTVYWQDIPARAITALKATFPKVDWVETAYDFAGDPLQRISSKVLCWARAAEEHATEPALVFCDSDTLVRRDLTPFFTGHDADVVFTTKPENVPLNSGVLLARGGPAATAFFRAWRDATTAILKDPAQFAEANDQSKPYGGTDQMSLFQLLGYARERDTYTIRCGAAEGEEPIEVRLRAEPCARLNETNSRPLSAIGPGRDIHVIHYKAGWQRILLDGRPFSRFRPRKESWDMFVYFMDTFRGAFTRLNSASGEKFTAREMGVQQPWYYLRGRFSWPGYAAWRAKEALKRGWLFLTGQLKRGA